MADTLVHRGPDGRGAWVSDVHAVGLGHRRLAVIDLSAAAAQPMVPPGGGSAISFNGEIYNFREVRRRLEQLGCRFTSSSDTEVLLHACRTMGVVEALRQVRGMFAFAYVDERSGELWLARDRFGEKPLYYALWEGGLAFASELKALRSLDGFPTDLDPVAVEMLMRHSCIGGSTSIYQSARKVLPGTAVRIRLADRLSEACLDPVRYWDPLDEAQAAEAQPFRGGLDAAADELDDLLGASTVGATVSDVPVGAFLSGGIDSTSVVSQLVRRTPASVRTFTIGFSAESWSEADQARDIARHLGTHHTELTVTPSDARSVIPSLPDIYDEPFADSSQIPTHLVAGLARQEVTVALSGDGGDELFGGYPRFRLAAAGWRRVKSVPLPLRCALACAVERISEPRLEATARLVGRGRLKGHSGDPAERVAKASAFLRARDASDVYRLFVTAFAEGSPLVPPVDVPAVSLPSLPDLVGAMMLREAISYLPDDILTKVDRAAMAVSLETRIPMLTPELLRFAHQLPAEMKLSGREGKVVVRHLLARHVPQRLWDRPKQGFGIPLGPWLRGPLREWGADLLSPPALRRHGLLDEGIVHRLWSDHQVGRRNWGSRLWNVLAFQAWYDRWMP